MIDSSTSFATDCSERLHTGQVVRVDERAFFVIEGDEFSCPVPGSGTPAPGTECDVCGPGREAPTSLFIELRGEADIVEVLRVRKGGAELLMVEFVEAGGVVPRV